MMSNREKKEPGEILKSLMESNKDYAAGNRAEVDAQRDAACSAQPQFPEAVVVSCLDSRVPVEQIFNKCVSDLFVARVAGNVMNADIVGSLEFAVLVNGVKLVMVLGHTSCGAVQGCCNGVELGSLTQLLDKIKPAFEAVKEECGEGVDIESAEFVNRVSEKNAELAAEQFLKSSPLIAEQVAAGKVKVVSAIYDLQSQLVSLVG